MTENTETATTEDVVLTDAKGVVLEKGMRVRNPRTDALATVIRLHAKSRRAVIFADDSWNGMVVTKKLVAQINSKTGQPTRDRKFLEGKRPELKGI